MKRIVLLFLYLLLPLLGTAQNLVPNGNFENIISCPTIHSQIHLAPPWRNYHSGGTPDLFNTCDTSVIGYGVPRNGIGWQMPASGNGYAGCGAFLLIANTSQHTEYLASPITAMRIGAIYEVSMSVSLSNTSGNGTNGMAMWFYDNGPTATITTSGTLTNVPQVFFLSYGNIIDTQNWVRLVATFIPDSAYDNIVIGKFNPPSGLTTATAGGHLQGPYYYIDSVVVRMVNGINNLYTDSLICAGDTFQVPYTLNSIGTFTGTNVFSVQLSNSSGSFNSGTTIIGTRTATTAGSITCVVPTTITPSNNYRIRIISTSSVDSSGPNQRNISIGITRPNVSNTSNSPVITGCPINLIATSTTTGVTYRWVGPSSYTSTLQTPTIASAITANSGNYIVTASLFGCIARDTTTVTLFSLSATATTPVCEHDSIILSATVPTTANSYSWTGPGNFSSSAKDTVRTNALPTMSGDYIFTAFYNGCSAKDTVIVQVKPPAANRTIGSNSPVCASSTLTLISGSTSSGVNYTWTGPNSFVANTANTSISNVSTNASGKYILLYELNGCIVKDSINVTINNSPIPVTASYNNTVCERDTLRLFSTNSSTGVTWAWTGPGSYTSTAQNPVRVSSTPSMSGDYIVTATNSFSCTAKDTVNVSVKLLPANFNATAGTICAGNTLFLSGNTTSTGVNFSWTGPNSFTSTLQNPNIPSATTAASGAYILSATLNGCTDKDTAIATVFPIPATPVPSANTPVCIGQDLKLTATNVAGATYAWTSTTSYSSTLQNPILSTATTAMAGKYYVQATANGCASGIDSITVTVNPTPIINMYPSPKDSICQGATLTLVSSQTNAGSAFQRKWYRNNTLIPTATGANYSTTTAADNDVYFVTLTGGNCAEPFTDTSSQIPIRVFPWLAPKVSITANPSTTVPSGTTINFTATPTNGGNSPTYQWTRNGGNIVGALSNTWGAPTLSNNDEVCVNMTSSYLCPNPKTVKSNCIRVSIETTGIKGTWAGKQPSVYPNPIKDVLIIESIPTGTIIQLTDVTGRTLINKTAINNNEKLNTQQLIPGNYILLLDDTKGNRIKMKITKE